MTTLRPQATNPQATVIGSMAILLWSSLALFTTQANSVPPLLLLTLTDAVLTTGQIIACLFITAGALFASLMPNKKMPLTPEKEAKGI